MADTALFPGLVREGAGSARPESLCFAFGRPRMLGGRRLEPELHEPVEEELLRVEERRLTRPRPEHDHEELLAVAPRGDRKVVPRLAREAGLERLDPARVVEERDVARVDAA